MPDPALPGAAEAGPARLGAPLPQGVALLDDLLRAELDAPVPDGVERAVRALVARHGAGVRAVLFYGSCLRRGTLEGVLDFYVLVDDYRSVHRSGAVAALNWLLPPNVFYLEAGSGPETVRAKYAVISGAEFLRRASGQSLDTRIWSRFCQPARLVYARDTETDREARDAVRRATLTAVDRMRQWLPGEGDLQRFRTADLWRAGLRETYGSELRSESEATIEGLYAEQSVRMDRVAVAALRELEQTGRLGLRVATPDRVELESSATARIRARRRWRWRRRAAKGLAILGLLKTPATFEGWASYAVWKLERQTGTRIELTPRQRRRPLVFGWPVLLRILRQRTLR